MMRQVRRAPVLDCICVHLRASAFIWEVLSRQTAGAQNFYFVSFCCMCWEPADAEGDERGARLFNDGQSSIA